LAVAAAFAFERRRRTCNRGIYEMSDGTSPRTLIAHDLEALLLCAGDAAEGCAPKDMLSPLFGKVLRVMHPSGRIEDGWQLLPDAQVDDESLFVEIEKGEQSLHVMAPDLLKLNADLLSPLPPPNASPAARTTKEVYLAKHPHVEGACFGDYVPSAAQDHVVLRESHVDIGSVKVADASWRGVHVDKNSCAFKLASHFISMYQKVCLDPLVPVASEAFSRWLAANSRALVGCDSDLHHLAAAYLSRQAAPFGCDFVDAVACLADECLRLVKLQPMLVRTRGHTKVYGDIHGQLADLLALFREHGFPSNRSGGDVELVSYIFDGDFVDRGPQQVEVMVLMLSLKVAFPERVFLLRGNHEFKEMNEFMDVQGFHNACREHNLVGAFWQPFYERICDVFDWLPFASLVEDSVLVVHGGIGDGQWAEAAHQSDIEWLDRTECRPLKTLFNQYQPDLNCMPGTHRHRTLLNILWSDPITDAKPSEWQPHWRAGRGADIIAFSSEVTDGFCARNGISMIIRGHEVAQGGYEMLHNGRLCTVFSARNYCGHRTNDAALVLLQPDLDGHLQVKFKTLQHLQ
jgi:diadenosine tetraphosphatase ApaH/serine/threonine PP2A family protein phosphatase